MVTVHGIGDDDRWIGEIRKINACMHCLFQSCGPGLENRQIFVGTRKIYFMNL